jgi:DNA-binding ferritin-like protein
MAKLGDTQEQPGWAIVVAEVQGLGTIIENLRGEIREGFKRVHERIDKTEGKIEEVKDKVSENERAVNGVVINCAAIQRARAETKQDTKDRIAPWYAGVVQLVICVIASVVSALAAAWYAVTKHVP